MDLKRSNAGDRRGAGTRFRHCGMMSMTDDDTHSNAQALKNQEPFKNHLGYGGIYESLCSRR
jgi:hypothetical protein